MSDNASEESSSAAPSEKEGTDGTPRSASSDGETQPLRNAVAALASMLGGGRTGADED